MRKGALGVASLAASISFLASPWAMADTATPFKGGDTAWMLTSTALVLLMTIPGLALFYGGMVRRKNILATAAQSFAVTALISVLWMFFGYSLAFTPGNAFIGGASRFFLHGLGLDSVNALAPTIPETVYMTFQMTFAIITPALIVGAFAERMKFSALLWFTGLWSLLVYAPIAHMVWGPGGWLGGDGVLDYAGGTVVHINAGIAGLVAALMIGKRVGYKHDNMHPANLLFTLMGAAMLWVGWFGFNAGSAVAASDRAGMAMAVTQIATAAAALAWMFVEWWARGKPTVLGMSSGAVAGLVAITPASGFVGPMGSLWIGIAAGVGCFWASVYVKNWLNYDDSLDAFGVHAVGGIIGALLTGVFAVAAIGGTAGVLEGNLHQLWIQATGVGITIGYDALVTWILLKVIDWVVGLRVSEEAEREGLDVTQHGEQIYM
ncbi:ammonium transporter [Acidithiobacillus sp. CV18-2]|uniref:Ammonium transporter n=1 Tax=Igneacidithiobacillus copahuensis TaxID=2724909 RepID=A0AAE3CKF5_9PROT|nr:ammonium transporter [Acidithiobacillus sp. CV18-3]MBU2757931.1 ammonium transporter [Acidithiobacillus sp. BN09-2]MBU2777740.1 ammonium transporter [Acidithiobacillus sp. CV18-2]MBU2788719.1 ammonium transporter [Igneacidithiobacillus copahuensis]MBU2796779.1 ammonium transporter [Acidithiobacillus sp. VAN18-2]MBU2800465.1 ammonium transporter [Acidithiobacillus sp. VAN18-4]